MSPTRASYLATEPVGWIVAQAGADSTDSIAADLALDDSLLDSLWEILADDHASQSAY